MPCNVLILGVTGMAGHVIKDSLERAGMNITSTSRDLEDTLKFNAFDVTMYDAFFDNIQVDFIVNCIGVLVEQSSKSPHLAYTANMVLPKYLEMKFSKTQTKIIHISTDCVFNGMIGAYKDTDIPDEMGVYGLSKAMGEIKNSKDVTIRTSIIGPELLKRGPNRTGLLHWFLSLESNAEISGFSRCFWSGISTLELSEVILWALQPHIVGLVHISRECKISKYDLLCIFRDVFNKPVTISSNPQKFIDKSLIPSQNAYEIKNDYIKMVEELKDYIDSHFDLYLY